MMPHAIPIDEFLRLARTLPVVDVRTPDEFLHGHIPGAINIPLFSNEERAIVGKLYVQSSRAAAIYRGLDFASRHAAAYLDAVEHLDTEEILLHCWRGGMRSEGIARLFCASGYTVHLLQEGYKAYRRVVLQSFQQPLPLRIIGGMTGSGKSEILHELEARNHQIIDLEALACHKGSAFGALGQPQQPSGEQFENSIHAALYSFDLNKPIWIEDESQRIGRVIIPKTLYLHMQNAQLYHLEVNLDTRIQRLIREYTGFNPADLCAAVEHISQRLGGQTASIVKKQIMEGDFYAAITAVLRYYDKTYRHASSRRDPRKIAHISIHTQSPRQIAEMLMEREKKCEM